MAKSKKHDFRVMSNLRCGVCGRTIKLNLAERKQGKDLLCYDHWRAIQKNVIRTARECRRTKTRKSKGERIV